MTIRKIKNQGAIKLSIVTLEKLQRPEAQVGESIRSTIRYAFSSNLA